MFFFLYEQGAFHPNSINTEKVPWTMSQSLLKIAPDVPLWEQ